MRWNGALIQSLCTYIIPSFFRGIIFQLFLYSLTNYLTDYTFSLYHTIELYKQITAQLRITKLIAIFLLLVMVDLKYQFSMLMLFNDRIFWLSQKQIRLVQIMSQQNHYCFFLQRFVIELNWFFLRIFSLKLYFYYCCMLS